ncbi:transposase [Clostridium tagluense]|nr:transposase [Clostridium tagluense]
MITLKKTVKSELDPVELNIPRDRNGEFEPKILPKYQRNITGIEDKIMALYAARMTTKDISEQVKNLYDVEISAEMISNITNRIIPVVNEWQNGALEKTYSFVFMDAERSLGTLSPTPEVYLFSSNRNMQNGPPKGYSFPYRISITASLCHFKNYIIVNFLKLYFFYVNSYISISFLISGNL